MYRNRHSYKFLLNDPVSKQLAQRQPGVVGEIVTGGRFVLFGAAHNKHGGQSLVADLMPILRQGKIRTLGIEVSPEDTEFINDLQRRVKNEGLKARDVEAAYADRFAQIHLRVSQSVLKDLGVIIEAGALNDIRVVGIDQRFRREGLVNSLADTLQQAKSPEQVNKGLMSFDGLIAQTANAERLKDGPDARMAILFGASHSCKPERQMPRPLATELEKYGTVSKVNLIQNLHESTLFKDCKNPDIKAHLNASSVLGSAPSPQ
jgi:hypothetical protein